MRNIIFLLFLFVISCDSKQRGNGKEHVPVKSKSDSTDEKSPESFAAKNVGRFFKDMPWNDFRSGTIFEKNEYIKRPFIFKEFRKDEPGVLSGLEVAYKKDQLIKLSFNYFDGVMTYAFRKILVSGKDTVVRLGVLHNNKHFLFECSQRLLKSNPLDAEIYDLRMDTVIQDKVHSRLISLGRGIKVRNAILINSKSLPSYIKQYWANYSVYSVFVLEKGQIFQESTTDTDYIQGRIQQITSRNTKKLIYSRGNIDFNNSISMALLFWEKERYPD